MNAETARELTRLANIRTKFIPELLKRIEAAARDGKGEIRVPKSSMGKEVADILKGEPYFFNVTRVMDPPTQYERPSYSDWVISW